MTAFLNACVAGVNDVGRGFCTHAAGMFVQSGVLIVALLLVDLVLRKRLRATLRYWIWMLVFVKLLLPPTLSLPTGIGYWVGGYATLPASISPLVPQPEGTHASAGVSTHPEVATRAGTSAARVPGAEVPPATVEPIESSAARGERLTWQSGVFLLWGIGVLVFTAWVIQRLRFVRRLVAQAEPAEGACLDLLDQCRHRVGARGRIEMKVSAHSFSPAVCGLWQPTILMPASLLAELSPGNLRAVLTHELAHVKRGDLWVNCLQAALQIIYFYNPLVWLANAIVRRVREQAVDEMSLVALGAEAGSYGHALIDIAEMAFLRASPALRLVGVAESKKSLEGRIKHMITRPIPKRARAGVVGMFAVAAMGAVMLPMAAAKTETPAGEFTARLSNGATVTLTGVCHWPEQEPVCWKPDGSRLDRDIRPARWSQRPDARDYGFMVRVTGPNSPELSWNRIAGAKAGTRECDVMDRRSKPVQGFQAVIVSLQDASAETAVRLGVAAGPWKTIFAHNGNGLKAVGGKEGILWSQAFEDSEGTHIIASTAWYTDRVKRVVAMDAGGVLHTDAHSSTVASGNVGQMTEAVFRGLPRDRIKEFQFQVRPYEWVEFTKVSLQPGHKTAVGINVTAAEYEAQKPAVSVSAPADEAVARLESARNLAQLGKAVWLYANDHQDKLPQALGEVEKYLTGADMSWLKDNVEYLKGRTITDRPDAVVAYDKTLLAKGAGTNVLYLDSHVVFESPSWLRSLGIGMEDAGAPIAEPRIKPGGALRVYPVNRRVADFPAAVDLSTPEAAYATINRIARDDVSAWQKVSIASLAERLAQENRQRETTADPEWAKVLLQARIRDVIVWKDTQAAVVAELPQGISSEKIIASIDVRYFQRENGRWLNAGNNRFWTVEEAEVDFMARFDRPQEKTNESSYPQASRNTHQERLWRTRAAIRWT